MVLARFLKQHGWRYLPGVFFLVLNAWISVLPARVLGDVIDELSLPSIDTAKVYQGILYLVLAAVAIFGTRYLWRTFIMGNARRLETFMRKELFVHFQSLSMDFYNHSATGDLIAYAINDIGAVRQTFGPALALSINGVVTSLVAILSMSGGVNGSLTLYSLLPVPVLIVLVVLMGGQVRSRFRRVQEAFAAVSGRVNENINGIRVIKAYAQEDNELARFESLNRDMLDTNVAMVKVSSAMGPMVGFIFGISFTISLIYGGALLRAGQITLGDFVAFNGYLTLIVNPVQSIARIINLLSRGLASLRRYNQVLAQPPMVVESIENAHEGQLKGGIQVKDLSFRYPYAPDFALRGVSFDLRPGKTLGILGHTGSGKTTLCNLLLKLYNPPEGSVSYDGADIHKIPLDTLREGIGYVPQDNFLFSASVRENIRFFDDSVSDEAVEAASKQADIYDNIIAFPGAFETMVGERGVTLSGGQKQRISIARALVKRPPILILDDALSAVDAQTEYDILNSLRGFFEGGTSGIIVAHRISALMHCDEIIVLDEGRVIERGSHEQLMNKGGFYAETAKKQADNQEGGE
ncbi:MAG: ABC transporter ATP-binding protein/permease, partial [Christensenellaceae bacterium]|nr:ABC transporter ATP-binding protein/permease [Christensenellaceae bacterium]